MKSRGGTISEAKYFQVELDGENLAAVQGQTIAEVLLAKRKLLFRKKQNDVSRSTFCGMGVCHECRMKVNGGLNVRTVLLRRFLIVALKLKKNGQVGYKEVGQ